MQQPSVGGLRSAARCGGERPALLAASGSLEASKVPRVLISGSVTAFLSSSRPVCRGRDSGGAEAVSERDYAKGRVPADRFTCGGTGPDDGGPEAKRGKGRPSLCSPLQKCG